MGDLILLYANDTSVDDCRVFRRPCETDREYRLRQTPLSGILNSAKYPCMCLVVRPTRGVPQDLRSFVKDRRGLWSKWRAHLRDPQDYMHVYQYCDERGLSVNAEIVGTYRSEDEIGPLVRKTVWEYGYYSNCMVSASVTHLFDKYPDDKTEVVLRRSDWESIVSLVGELSRIINKVI